MKMMYLLLFISTFGLNLSCNPSQDRDGEYHVRGVANPIISLNGVWKFTMEPSENFWEQNESGDTWQDIQVPGECQMQGFAIRHNQAYAYKKEFRVPTDYQDMKIMLDFHGVYSHAKVWVNGKYVRDHYGGFTKWSCDITGLVSIDDINVLTVQIVDRVDDISYGSGYAKHQIGGILRDVVLKAVPHQHFKRLFFETDLDEQYADANLKVFYELTQNTPVTVQIDLYNSNKERIAGISRLLNSPTGNLEIPVVNPQKWDAEHPNLYSVITSLIHDQNEILRLRSKIGFREVEVRGNQLLVNGYPVKLRGANRHDIHPLLGRMTTPEYDKKDVILAKEANMNFIRTSHYPPSEAFLKYCDQYGIYVEDETAVCFVGSHRTEAYRASGASQNDTTFSQCYLSQLQEMVDNHRNHPSVIMWSIGNENVYGKNFVDSYQWVKANDQSRPVIYSYPGQVPKDSLIFDVLSMHYPGYQGNLVQYGIPIKGFDYEEMPVIFDEWAHVACYNNFELKADPNVRNFWGQSLDSMWTKLFDTKGGLGGAIWCMLDETFMLPKDLDGFNQWWGILDKNVIPATYEGPTVGYGEWGIIDTWRRKKPEFWATKKAYSPTKIYVKYFEDFEPGKPLSIPVHNRFDHTNFSELKIVWKYHDQKGVLSHIQLEPHQKGTLEIPAQNWMRNDKLHLSFLVNDTTLIDEYTIQLGKPHTNLPYLSKETVTVEEKPDKIIIRGNNYSVELSKNTGLLQNLVHLDQLLIKEGPFVNLKIPGNQVQWSTIQMDDYAQNWRLSSYTIDTKAGVPTIITKGSYDSIEAQFIIKLDPQGLAFIDYEILNIPENNYFQECGIRFNLGDDFDSIRWNRESYFSAYPEGHLGSPAGSVHLNDVPRMEYRKHPNHRWESDNVSYYYFGLDTSLPLTNLVRAQKENIYSYALAANKAKMEVLSDGKQACRFDRLNSINTLFVNDIWDYNSLMWGNYMKKIPTKSRLSGRIILSLGEH